MAAVAPANNNPPQAPPAPFIPTKPKFGDVVEVGTGTWVAWTGGEPKADWTELKQTAPVSIDSNQYRVTLISARSKQKYYRTLGFETKFTRTSDLQTFQRKIWKHLVGYGMGTITYLPDPSMTNKVVSVIDHHARFEVKSGVTKANELVTNLTWDSYDLDNIRDAKEFLLNCISEDLEKQLYEVCDEQDSFAAYWLQLIHIIKSVSIDRFDKIKDRIKARKLSDYPGENIKIMASAYLTDWQELHGAGLYDQNLTMTMLNAILLAASGSEEAETFCYPLRDIKDKLNTKLLQVRHMDYSTAHQAMATDDLDVRTVLEAAKDQYREMYDGGKWPAAAHAKDSKAMNRNYGNANAAIAPKGSSKDLENMMFALVQNMNNKSSNKSGPKRSSYRQGKKDGKQFNSQDKSARNNPRKNGSKKPIHPPPGPGESEIKVIDGVKRYFCKKCDRWTLSHTTEQHVPKEELKKRKDASAGMARVKFDLHPAAYKVCKPVSKSNNGYSLPTVLPMMLALSMISNGKLLTLWNWIIQTATFLKPVLTGLVQAVINEFASNFSWIGVIATIAAGMIASGTGWYLYHLVPEPTNVDPPVKIRY